MHILGASTRSSSACRGIFKKELPPAAPPFSLSGHPDRRFCFFAHHSGLASCFRNPSGGSTNFCRSLRSSRHRRYRRYPALHCPRLERLDPLMNQCQSLEDAKTAEPPVLYLPAELSGAATPPAVPNFNAMPCSVGTFAPHHYRPRPNRSRCASEKWPAVPRKPLRRSRWPIQRDVWLGQLFHHPRPVSGSPPDPSNLALAQGMVENFFFEIEHYGGVLNANRTYYLTRSQPPFLTSMILAVYEARQSSTAQPCRRRAIRPIFGGWRRLTPTRCAITGNGPRLLTSQATLALRAISIAARARCPRSWTIPAIIIAASRSTS